MARPEPASHRTGSSRNPSKEDVSAYSAQEAAHHPPERAASQSKDLKFVAVTEQSLQGMHDANEQKSIRSHVMKDFLRQRETGESTPQLPPPMAESQAGRMGRFRLNTKPRRKQTNLGSPDRVSPRSKSRCLNKEVLPKPPDGGLVSSMLPLLEPANLGTLSPLLGQGTSQTSPSLWTGRIDPFAEVSFPKTLGAQKLVDYCKSMALPTVPSILIRLSTS